jgi:hypothetical protein
MSTKRDTRYAAKRRAANKKRMRETVRYIAVFGFIGMLIIGTVSTIYIASSPATTTGSSVPTAAPTNALSSLVTQGDAAIAKGDYAGGIAYYRAYLSSQQNSTDSNTMFKLGQAYVDSKNPTPDYLLGLVYLQQAQTANPSATWAQQAASLINQFAPQASAEATTTAVAALSATKVPTGTTSLPSSGAPQSPITATGTITK